MLEYTREDYYAFIEEYIKSSAVCWNHRKQQGWKIRQIKDEFWYAYAAEQAYKYVLDHENMDIIDALNEFADRMDDAACECPLGGGLKYSLIRDITFDIIFCMNVMRDEEYY